MRRYFLYAAVICLFSVNLFAQQEWTAVLVVDPNPSPYFNDWERDPSIGTLLINTPAGTPETEFFCRLQIFLPSYKSGTPIIEGKSSSISIAAGPQSQIYRYADIVDWKDVDYDKSLYETIVRSGRLLEGEYELRVLMYRYPESSSSELLAEASAFFTISYPNPPEIISPENQSTITEPYPIFMWSPVILPQGNVIKYHLKIVERINAAVQPERELEANSVHFEADIEGLSNYTYPADALPLETGKEYIWQITAADENGFAPSQNNGKSEVYTFSFGVKKVIAKAFSLDQLLIAENFVFLNDIRSLEMTEEPLLDQYILNGNGTLEIRFPNTQPRLISANIEGLKFQKDYYTPPNFSAGTIKANLFPGDIPESITGPYFQPTDLEYSPITGFTIGGLLNLPGSTGYQIGARFSFEGGQISGIGSVMGLPLVALGDDKVKLLINEAEIHFSTPKITLKGEIQLFGEVLNCTLPDILLTDDGEIEVELNCTSPIDINLMSGSAVFNMKVNTVEGICSFSLSSGTMSYDFDLNGGIDLSSGNLFSLGADIGLNLTPASLDLISFRPRGSAGIPPLDLGLLKLQLANLSLDQFSFTGGLWDFNISADISLNFPAFGNSTLSQNGRVNFSRNGLNLPEINLSGLDLPKANFGFTNLMINSLKIPGITLDWPSFSSGSFAGLNISADMNLGFSGLPGNVSEEFRNLVIPLSNISLQNGSLNITLPDLSFPGYNFSLGGGLNFLVTGLSGNITGDFAGGINLIPEIYLKGKIDLPSGFACAGTSQLDISREGLKLSSLGKITGVVQNVIPDCPIEFHGLHLTISRSDMKFSEDGSRQRVLLDGTGNLALNSIQGTPVNAEVNFVYDIINNDLISINGSINTPYVLNIPEEESTLKFVINNAVLDAQNLSIDGRNSILLSDGTSINATFNNVRYNFSKSAISSGNILLDMPFALKGSIDKQKIAFQTANINSSLSEENSILIKLPETISIGKSGISITGSGVAHLKMDGCNLPELVAAFSNDFALSLDPFKIRQGQCEIMYGSSRIVLLNTNGFFPNMNFVAQALLPDKLPLISEQIAFIKLWENGNLLLDQTFENGNIRLKTRAGNPVKMVFPSLQFNHPQPPEVSVNFDITVDQVEYDLVNGEITVNVPANSSEEFDLSAAGIPFIVKGISFKKIDNSSTFSLRGNLKLFDNVIDETKEKVLCLRHGGVLGGEINYVFNQSIPLVPGSDKINLNLSSLTGLIDIKLLPLQLDYNLVAEGKFQMKASADYLADVRLGISPDEGLEILKFEPGKSGQDLKISMDWLELELSDDIDLRAIRYTHNPGFNFEISLGVVLKIPSLNVSIPKIPNITLSKDGFTFPQLSVTKIPSVFHEIQGLSIRARNLRREGQFTLDWFHFTGTLGDPGFKLDLELKIPDLPSSSSAKLKNKTLSVLNASVINGKFSGIITTVNSGVGFSLPLTDSIIYYVSNIDGNLSTDGQTQNISLSFKGKIRLPGTLGCPENTDLDISASSVNYINGKLSGTVVGPRPACSFQFGLGSFTVINDTLDFSVENNVQKCIFTCNGELRLPGVGGNTAAGTGRLIFDFLNGSIVDGSVRISQPFKVQMPKENPVLIFSVNNGLLDKDGFTINGSGNLQLEGGTAVVQFNNLKLKPADNSLQAGSITLTNNFALKLTAGDGLHWSTVPANYNLSTDNSVLLNLPSTIMFDANGIKLRGSSTISFKWMGTTYSNKSCNFADLVIGLSPFGVTGGRAAIFNSGTDTLVVIDRNGIIPKSLLDVNLPAQIPLPDLATAYLQIKDANNRLLVSYEKIPSGIKLNTTSPVKLYLPALRGNAGADIPSYDITLNNLVVSEPGGTVVSGSIELTLPSGFSLVDRNIPLKLKKLLYEKINNAYVLKAFADIYLPQSLNSLVTEVVVKIEAAGITGILSGAGTFSETAGGPYLKSFTIGNTASTIKLQGINFNFSQNERSFKLSGDLITTLFTRNNTESPAHFKAEWNSNAYNFSLLIPQGTSFPFGSASFEITRSLFNVTDQNYNISIGGLLTLRDLNNMSITVDPITFSNNGISFSSIAVSTDQTFKIFGADFTLKNVGRNNAITASFVNNILYLTLCGEIEFLGKKLNFTNLKVGTNGSISLAEGSAFVDGTMQLISDYLTLKRFELTGSPVKLRLTGEAKLPAPAANFMKEFSFSMRSNGEVEGSAVINILNTEASRLDNSSAVDASEYDLNFAVFDPTHLSLNLDFANLRNSSLRLIADLYLTKTISGSQNKKIAFGAANPFAAGLELKFDGTRRWNVSGSYQLNDIKWEILKLNNVTIGVEGNGNDFALLLAGKLLLDLPGIGGTGLDFSGLRFTSEGNIENLTSSIRGGRIELLQTASLDVSKIEYSNTPTNLDLRGGSSPTAASPNGNTTAPASINVQSYFRFGGQFSIDGLASGGVEDFLYYKTTSGGKGLVIKNANLTIQELLTFNADFQYQDLGANKYNFLVGGSGKLLDEYEMAVVGKLARTNKGVSFGLFVAGDIPPITIPPCILLTGLGGGFFLNPEQSDLNLVKQLAALGDAGTSSKITDPGGFAVLLFAKAVIASESLVEGRALLTVTENYLALDGKFTLLSQTNKVYGTAHLAIGFDNFYAEGNINITVAISDFVDGNGSLNFFVYGANEWGLTGNLDLELFNILNSSSNLYVGSEGLLLSINVNANLDIWIIEVESGIEGSIWLTDNSWGAYCKAYIYVEVLDGLASAKGWLQGVLLLQPKFRISAMAGLAVSVGPFDWSGSVWAAISSDGLDGGFGYDSELAKLVKNAKSTAAEMNAAADEGKAAIEAALMAKMRYSDEDLAAAFQSMLSIAQWVRYGTPEEKRLARGVMESMIEDEVQWYDLLNLPPEIRRQKNTETALLTWIENNIMFAADALPPININELKIKRDELDQLIASHNTERTEVADRFDRISNDAQITELTQRNFIGSESPLGAVNFSFPQATSSRSPNGKNTKSITSKPGFDLDKSAADRNKNTITQAASDLTAFENEIKTRISTLENGLTSLNEALTGTEGQTSHLGVGTHYWTLLNKLENFYKEFSIYYYNEWQWTIQKRNLLRTKEAEIRNIMNSKTTWIGLSLDPLASNRNSRLTEFVLGTSGRYSLWFILEYLTSEKEQAANEFVTRWQSLTLEGKKELCSQLGLDLWYNTEMAGLEAISHADQVKLNELFEAKNVEMDNVNTAQVTYTASMDAIYDKKVLLTENLYDIYSRYKYWKQSQTDEIKSQPIRLADIESKRNGLLHALKVPVVNTINVSSTNGHTYNYCNIGWSAACPAGITDYAIMFDGTGTGGTRGFVSVGDMNFIYRWILRSGNVTRQNNTISVRARGGAGFTNTRSNIFATEFGSDNTQTLSSRILADNSAPSPPTVELPNLQKKNFPSGLKYYTSDPNKLAGSWVTNDDESGIVEYQYSIISLPANNVLGWTTAAGMNSLLIQGLNLQTGTSYKLRAKALNGQGTWSSIGSSGELIVDTTPPTTPGFKYVAPYFFISAAAPLPQTIPPVPLPDELQDGSAPVRELIDLNMQNPIAERPTLSVSWNASTDDQSGVLEYKYKVISATDPSVQSDSAISVGTTLQAAINRSKFGHLSFLDSYYVDVYAFNLLGLKSEPLRIGPLTPIDYTPPTTPAAAVSHGPVNGSAFLIFTEESIDWETEIKGYQIAIGTTRGGTDKKGWNDSVDFKPQNISSVRSWYIPDYNLPDGTYYISLRAKNKQNTPGNFCVTGPYVIDNSRPLRPGVSAARSGDNLNIQFTNITDPHSAITNIEYAIGTTNNKRDIRNWTPIPKYPREIDIPYSELNLQEGRTYYIFARTTNFVGLVSQTATTSYTYVLLRGGR